MDWARPRFAASLVSLRGRLHLSSGKHRSLAGHARIGAAAGVLRAVSTNTTKTAFSAPTVRPPMSPRAAAPASCALAALYQTRFAKTAALTAEVAESISDLQFTAAYRVPFQFSRFVRQHLQVGRVRTILGGRYRHGSRRQRVLRRHRLLRRQCSWLRFLQAGHGARLRTRRGARSGARPLSSGRRRQREAAEGNFRARRSLVSHVGDRSGDAGGAAGALSHAALASGALLRRLSRLVGRRAAGHRQSAAGARDLHACRICPRSRCACCRRGAISPACWSIRCRGCIPT